jgi:hypothetical protein
VQIQPVFPRDERVRLFEVGPEFVRGARLAGIIAGDCDPASAQRCSRFKAADIVPLPAMERDAQEAQLRQRRLHIHAKFTISLDGREIRRL